MRISDEHMDMMLKQIALDCNTAEAEAVNENIFISPTKVLKGSRRIDKLDPFFRVIIIMGKAYVMAEEELIPGFAELLKSDSADWFFNYGHLRKLDHILHEFDREIIDTHIYYLPDADARRIEADPEYRWLDRDEISAIKGKHDHRYALCYSPTQPDYVAVVDSGGMDVIDSCGIFYPERIRGIAGASLDGEYTRQIGIDVSDAYRGKGIGVKLVTTLKQSIMEEGYLPFYGTNESHALSRMVGVRSGFLPAFSELFVGRIEE
ncbi:MAG: hypothetical protein K5662_07535 [Lachnospiraceae bacterium]|nr:hypothetical protein [Lachnospiraceae bacterium]